MMLESVRILGHEFHSGLEPLVSSSLQDFLSVAKVKKIRYVLGIVIKDASYLGITVEEKIDEKIEKYLYSAGSANGPDKTPTSIITIPERTFRNKILRWFDKFAISNNRLIAIRETLMKNEDIIIDNIKKQINDLRIEKKMGSIILLTVKIRESSDEKDIFIGELDSVKGILLSLYQSGESSVKDEHDIDAVKNSPKLCQCYFCGENNSVIAGRSPISDIFSFSTFDKRGFLYDFNRHNMHKQIPVCNDCYFDLKRGKEWLDQYTYFNFEGYKYYVIPNIVADTNDKKTLDNQLHDFISEAEEYAKEQNTKKRKTPLRYENYLMHYEQYLLEDMVEKHISAGLLFLFVSLKGGGKYIDIEKYVEDIPITWIARILDVYNKLVLDKQLFSEESMRKIFGQNWKHGRLRDKKNEMYLASVIKLFFPVDSLDIKFLDVISKILTASQIHSRVIIEAFMRSIRPQIYKNWSQAKMITLKSLVLFATMLKLQLISDVDPINIDRSIRVNFLSSPDSHLDVVNDNDDVRNEAFFDEILDTNQKKAVFLEGLLVGKLLSIQYAVRKSTPFVDVLHGLHLNFSRAKSLLPKIVAKLREYQTAYIDIEKKVAHYFLLSEKANKQLSDDETSYYFTLGMLLHSSINMTPQK